MWRNTQLKWFNDTAKSPPSPPTPPPFLWLYLSAVEPDEGDDKKTNSTITHSRLLIRVVSLGKSVSALSYSPTGSVHRILGNWGLVSCHAKAQRFFSLLLLQALPSRRFPRRVCEWDHSDYKSFKCSLTRHLKHLFCFEEERGDIKLVVGEPWVSVLLSTEGSLRGEVEKPTLSSPLLSSALPCSQKRAEWHRLSLSSGGIHGWHDANAGQRQLPHCLHHPGRGPEGLPVCWRNHRHGQGALFVFLFVPFRVGNLPTVSAFTGKVWKQSFGNFFR